MLHLCVIFDTVGRSVKSALAEVKFVRPNDDDDNPRSDDDDSTHYQHRKSPGSEDKEPPDSAVDVDDLSSLDGINGNGSSLVSPADNGLTSSSWPSSSFKRANSSEKPCITSSTPLPKSSTEDSGMGDSYREESKWEYVGHRREDESSLPSVKALRSQFETVDTVRNSFPRNAFARKGVDVVDGSGSLNTYDVWQVRRSKSVVDKTMPELLESLEKRSGTLPPKLRKQEKNGLNGGGSSGWGGVRTAKPIFSPDQPPDDVIPSIIAQFGCLVDMNDTPRQQQQQHIESGFWQWDMTPLLRELYRVQSPQPPHEAEKSCFINIEGYLDKLPSGRRKSTFWNAWKRRYFRLKDGYLYYYQNHSSEKPSLTLNLMGGKVDSMDTTMLGVDDGKGHYVVVRCSSKIEMENWKTALNTHTAENFNLTYAQPVPAYPHFYEDVLIIDLGSCSVRAGILCNQPTLPQLFFPSVSSLHRETLEKVYGMEALSPSVKANGSVTFPLRPSTKVTKFSVDLDAVEGLLMKVFKDLKMDPRKLQIQLSLPRNFTVRTQTEVLKLLFDRFSVRSVNLTSQNVLSLLSYNATSGIVVDIGERMDVIPIIDGYVVEPGVSRIPYGGSRVMEHLRHFLTQRHYNLVSDVETYLVRYVLENICYCAEKYSDELQRFFSDPESFEESVSIKKFVSADAPWDEITLDCGRFQAAEGLFNPDAWGLDHPGVHKLVHRAIQECSLDIRKEMTRSIYLSGGLTLLPGFSNRLEAEVNKLTPPSLTPKVHASPYRYHSAYLGACILASSPGFQEAKITAEDWNKNGAQCLRKWHL